MKYTLEFKLECISKYKKGENPNPYKRNESGYTSFRNQLYLWIKQYDDLGIKGLKHSSTNKDWNPEKRFELVAKILAGNSIASVARNAYINPGQVYQWVKRYNEKGMDGLKCKKGRPSRGLVMKKEENKEIKLSVSEQEEMKLLRERNEYLEMENEYLKKLDALVSKREAAEAKVKKQK